MNHLWHLLRLHVEAVWNVQFNAKIDEESYTEVELLAADDMPPWQLCLAKLLDDASTHIAIWRPEVQKEQRSMLLAQATEALDLSPAEFRKQRAHFPAIHREVAFHQTAEPTITLATASGIARLLTHQDAQLLEDFETASSTHYLNPSRQPLVGVIAENKLLCLAHSSRRTTEACELGIDTLPSARRKGYALAATILWAELVKQAALLPIYSAFIENEPSLALAHSAGYRPFAHIATITIKPPSP